MTDKNIAREYIRKLRNEMSERENQNLSQIICEQIFDMNEFKEASNIRTYMSFRNEVDTTPIINKCFSSDIIISVPKVVGNDMNFNQIKTHSELIKGYMGILEPQDGLLVMDSHKGIIIVPGLVFDRKGNRAGYGKGFYDRYLAKFPELIKIGIAFNFQIVDEIDTNPYDIPMDYIVTDKEIIKIQ